MEHIARRLRRKSTLRGNDFDYSIKRENGKVSPEPPQILLSQADITPKQEEFKVNSSEDVHQSSRRPNRFKTMEIPCPVNHIQKKFSFNDSSSNRETYQIPIDFSRSLMNTPKSVISQKNSESVNSFSSRIEKVLTPKFDYKGRFFAQDKIAEISSSQEISMPDLKNYKKNKHSRTNSISFEIESNVSSLIYGKEERLSIHPFLTVAGDVKSDPTCETDKNNDFLIRSSRLKISQTELNQVSFDEALRRFNSMTESYTEVSLWIRSPSEYLCCCLIRKSDLSEDFQNLCEKLIIFAYSGFDSSNIFHASLLASVFNSLQNLQDGKSTWVEVGFSSNNPYEKDLAHNIAPLGLLLLMFLAEYIPSTLKNMMIYCVSLHISFVSLAFDVAEIAILTLRKKKLNDLMDKTQKCLEIVFFFFAGCLAEWFSLHKENPGSIRKVHQKLESQAFSDPNGFINLAKTLLSFQME
jgi:hypothetical protein